MRNLGLPIPLLVVVMNFALVDFYVFLILDFVQLCSSFVTVLL